MWYRSGQPKGAPWTNQWDWTDPTIDKIIDDAATEDSIIPMLPEIQRRLARALRAAVTDPAVAQPLEAQGLIPAPSSPGELQELIRADYRKWRKVFADKEGRT